MKLLKSQIKCYLATNQAVFLIPYMYLCILILFSSCFSINYNIISIQLVQMTSQPLQSY